MSDLSNGVADGALRIDEALVPPSSLPSPATAPAVVAVDVAAPSSSTSPSSKTHQGLSPDKVNTTKSSPILSSASREDVVAQVGSVQVSHSSVPTPLPKILTDMPPPPVARHMGCRDAQQSYASSVDFSFHRVRVPHRRRYCQARDSPSKSRSGRSGGHQYLHSRSLVSCVAYTILSSRATLGSVASAAPSACQSSMCNPFAHMMHTDSLLSLLLFCVPFRRSCRDSSLKLRGTSPSRTVPSSGRAGFFPSLLFSPRSKMRRNSFARASTRSPPLFSTLCTCHKSRSSSIHRPYSISSCTTFCSNVHGLRRILLSPTSSQPLVPNLTCTASLCSHHFSLLSLRRPSQRLLRQSSLRLRFPKDSLSARPCGHL